MLPIKPLRSATFRLALWYGVLFCGSALLLVGFLFWQTTVYMDRQVDAILRTELTTLAGTTRTAEDLPALIDRVRQRVFGSEDDQLYYLLIDPRGAAVVTNVRAWQYLRRVENGVLELRLEPGERKTGRVVRMREAVLVDGYRLLVGLDVEDEEAVQNLIAETLATGVVFMIVLAAVGALLFRQAVVLRLQQVNRTCEEIMTGDLSRRVPSTDSGDEFDHLALNLNRMLDEIHYLMESKRNMSNTIAHDLRHPLTRLKSHLESALAAELDRVRMRETIVQSIADLDEVVALFNALLRISRVEAGSGRESFAAVDPARIVEDVTDLYQPLAEEKGLTMTIQLESGMAVFGDGHLLSQAIANLVDNAVKYTQSGGRIDVVLKRVGNTVHLGVTDNGPGIPAEYRPLVTRRFFRLDQSRSTPGHGLGLTLVIAVAKLHGGQLLLDDNEPGLSSRIVLPLLPADRLHISQMTKS